MEEAVVVVDPATADDREGVEGVAGGVCRRGGPSLICSTPNTYLIRPRATHYCWGEILNISFHA